MAASRELYVEIWKRLESYNPQLVKSWSFDNKIDSCCQPNCHHTDNSPLIRCMEINKQGQSVCGKSIHLDCCLNHSTNGLRVRADGRLEFFCSEHNKAILYCSCRKPYEEGVPMIQCDTCKEWYHVECSEVKKNEKKNLEDISFECKPCVSQLKALIGIDGAVEKYKNQKYDLSVKKEQQDHRNQIMREIFEELLHRADSIAECIDDMKVTAKKKSHWASIYRNDRTLAHCKDCIHDLESPDTDAGNDGDIVKSASATSEQKPGWLEVTRILRECCQISKNEVLRQWHVLLSAHVNRLTQWAEQAGKEVCAMIQFGKVDMMTMDGSRSIDRDNSNSTETEIVIFGEGHADRVQIWANHMKTLRSLVQEFSTERCAQQDMKCFDCIVECSAWLEDVFLLVSTDHAQSFSSSSSSTPFSSSSSSSSLSDSSIADGEEEDHQNRSRTRSAQAIQYLTEKYAKGEMNLKKLQVAITHAIATKDDYNVEDEAFMKPLLTQKNSEGGDNVTVAVDDLTSLGSLQGIQGMYHVEEFALWYKNILQYIENSLVEMESWREDVNKINTSRKGHATGITLFIAKDMIHRAVNVFPFKLDTLHILRDAVNIATQLDKRIITALFAQRSTCKDINVNDLETLGDDVDNFAGISLPLTEVLKAILVRIIFIQEWGESGIFSQDDEDKDKMESEVAHTRHTLKETRNVVTDCYKFQKEWSEPNEFTSNSPFKRILTPQIDAIHKRFSEMITEVESVSVKILHFVEQRMNSTGHKSQLQLPTELHTLDSLLNQLEVCQVESVVHEKFLRTIRAMHVAVQDALDLQTNNHTETTNATVAVAVVTTAVPFSLETVESTLAALKAMECSKETIAKDSPNVYHKLFKASKASLKEIYITLQRDFEKGVAAWRTFQSAVEVCRSGQWATWATQHSSEYSTESIHSMSMKRCLQVMYERIKSENSLKSIDTENLHRQLLKAGTDLEEDITQASQKLQDANSQNSMDSDVFKEFCTLSTRACYLPVSSEKLLHLKQCHDLLSLNTLCGALETGRSIVDMQDVLERQYSWLPPVKEKYSSDAQGLYMQAASLAGRVSMLQSNTQTRLSGLSNAADFVCTRFQNVSWYSETRQVLSTRGDVEAARRLYKLCSEGDKFSDVRNSHDFSELQNAIAFSETFATKCQKPLALFNSVIEYCNKNLINQQEAGVSGRELVRQSLIYWESIVTQFCADAYYNGGCVELVNVLGDLLIELQKQPLHDIKTCMLLKRSKAHFDTLFHAKTVLNQLWDLMEEASSANSPRAKHEVIEQKSLGLLANQLVHISTPFNSADIVNTDSSLSSSSSSSCDMAHVLREEILFLLQEHEIWLGSLAGILPQKATRGAVRQLPLIQTLKEKIELPIAKAIKSQEYAILKGNFEKCQLFMKTTQEFIKPQYSGKDNREPHLQSLLPDIDFVDEESRADITGDSDSDSGGDGSGYAYNQDQIDLEALMRSYERNSEVLIKQGNLLDIDVTAEINILQWIQKLMRWTFAAPKSLGREYDVKNKGLSYEEKEKYMHAAFNIAESLPQSLLQHLKTYGVIAETEIGTESSKMEEETDYCTAMQRTLKIPAFTNNAHWLLREASKTVKYFVGCMNEADQNGLKLQAQLEILREKGSTIKGGAKSPHAVPLFSELSDIKQYVNDYNKAKLNHVIHLPKKYTSLFLSKKESMILFDKSTAVSSKIKDGDHGVGNKTNSKNRGKSSSSSSSSSGKPREYKEDLGDTSSDEDNTFVSNRKRKHKGNGSGNKSKFNVDGASEEQDNNSSSSSGSSNDSDSSDTSSSDSDNDNDYDNDLSGSPTVKTNSSSPINGIPETLSSYKKGPVKAQVDPALFNHKLKVGASGNREAKPNSKLQRSSSSSSGSSNSIQSSSPNEKRERAEARKYKEKPKVIEKVEEYTVTIRGKLCCNSRCKDIHRSAVGHGLGLAPSGHPADWIETDENGKVNGMLVNRFPGYVTEIKKTVKLNGVVQSVEVTPLNSVNYCSDICAQSSAGDVLAGMLSYRKRLSAATAAGSGNGNTDIVGDDLVNALSSTSTQTDTVTALTSSEKIKKHDKDNDNGLYGGTTKADRIAFAAKPQDVNAFSTHFEKLFYNGVYPPALGLVYTKGTSGGVSMPGEATMRALSASEWTAQAAREQLRANVRFAFGDLAKKDPKIHSWIEQNSKSMVSTENRKRIHIGGDGSEERRNHEHGKKLLRDKLDELGDIMSTPTLEPKGFKGSVEDIFYSHLPQAAFNTLRTLENNPHNHPARISAEKALRKVLFVSLLCLIHNPIIALHRAGIIARQIENTIYDKYKPNFDEEDHKMKEAYKLWVAKVQFLKNNLGQTHVLESVVKRILEQADYTDPFKLSGTVIDPRPTEKQQHEIGYTINNVDEILYMNAEYLCLLSSDAFMSKEKREQKEKDKLQAVGERKRESTMDKRGELLAKSANASDYRDKDSGDITLLLSGGSKDEDDADTEVINTISNNSSSPNSFNKRFRDDVVYSDDAHLLDVDGRTIDRIGGSGGTDHHIAKMAREIAREKDGASVTVTDCDAMSRSHLSSHKNKGPLVKQFASEYVPGVGVKIETIPIGGKVTNDDDSGAGAGAGFKRTRDDDTIIKATAPLPINTLVSKKGKNIVFLADVLKSSSRDSTTTPPPENVPVYNKGTLSKNRVGGIANAPSVSFAHQEASSATNIAIPVPDWVTGTTSTTNSMQSSDEIYCNDDSEHIPISLPVFTRYDEPTYLLNQDGTGHFTLKFSSKTKWANYNLACIGVTNNVSIQGLLPSTLLESGTIKIEQLDDRMKSKKNKRLSFVPIVFTFSGAEANDKSGPLHTLFWTKYYKTNTNGGQNRASVSTYPGGVYLYLVSPKHKESLSVLKNDEILSDRTLSRKTHERAGTQDGKLNCLYGIVEFDTAKPPNRDFLGNFGNRMEGLLSKAALHVNDFLSGNVDSNNEKDTYEPEPVDASNRSSRNIHQQQQQQQQQQQLAQGEQKQECEQYIYSIHQVAANLAEKFKYGVNSSIKKKKKIKSLDRQLADLRADSRSIAGCPFIFEDHPDFYQFYSEYVKYNLPCIENYGNEKFYMLNAIEQADVIHRA